MQEPSTAKGIDLGIVYQEVTEELRALELKAAELRGQLALLERLIAQIQASQNGHADPN